MSGEGARKRKKIKRAHYRVWSEMFKSNPLGLLAKNPSMFFTILKGKVTSCLKRMRRKWAMNAQYRSQIRENKKAFGPDYISPREKRKLGPYERAGKISVNEGLRLIHKKQSKMEVFGKMVKIGGRNKRYSCYREKGVQCVKCGRKGKYFAVEKHRWQQEVTHFHLNLYSVDKAGEEMMMTVDHIIPKSKGGSDAVENLEPMCEKCNTSKADKMPEEGRGLIKGQKKEENVLVTTPEVVDTVANLKENQDGMD